jgi:hypothetical protein
MADPLTWGVLGALVATEGIKFLYGQATEVLKRWRDRKAGREAEAQTPIPVPAHPPLEGTIEPPTVDFDAVERLHDDIKALRSALGDYADGLADPEPGDQDLAAAADGLRRALEVVYGQRMTFRGEDRAPSGPTVIGRAEADIVAGEVTGIRARLVRSGRVEATAVAKEVRPGGKLTGGACDTIG